tara:strand:+ start:948 stop:1958 length:1011 start_codon:yes stop_codon:yes gene_type:complete
MAKGQQKIVIPPPVPGTPEYYYNLRAGRDLLPMEKRLGMVRDPNYKYEYTCDNKTPFRYSLALYSFIILILYFSCTNISIPEPDRPIVLQMSFGDSESEDLIDTIEVENLGIQSDVVSEDVGSTDQIVELEPEPEPEPEPETNNFEEYWASIQPEESGEPIEDQSDSTAEAGKVISTMTGAIGQATSSNHAVASRYGSGDSMEMRLAKAGAQTGKIQVSLFWNTGDDIDLHVTYAPGNGYSDTINFQNRYSQLSGGILDVDMNANGPNNYRCVENVFWPNNVPRGFFMVQAHFYKSFTGNQRVPIMVRIKVGNDIEVFNGVVFLGQSPVLIHRFRY